MFAHLTVNSYVKVHMVNAVSTHENVGLLSSDTGTAEFDVSDAD